ncbi:protein kinase domain-containing protein [Microbacterium rhizomatis]|uniref:non-specific serine/threonine protein kinase n=1 Tax=Microbacterium rhizomatis TaxID=1631477 RepID=A0A5J5J413_9MICO|nr:PASTA domain-containing protein [Microbacterium rhizomatis]KAA9110987.1 PASTA domain-containing protein [Microbacterium rhizomatis]
MRGGLVAGRFHLRALLGSGGTAAVFAAVDEQTGRDVALKLLHPHLAVERAVWDAFFEEVHAAQSIDHPGLAEIFDAGAVDAEPPIVWIAMERVHGVSLADHVHAHGPLATLAAVALTDATLDALAAAHAGGVVHRDITPANIMFDPALLGPPFDRAAFTRSVRLLDFGLADVPGRSTAGADALLSARGSAPATVVASVPYASPEQLSAQPVGERSDLYQLGATLYFALTGRPPFAGDTATVVRAHLTAPPPVPSTIRRDVPRSLDRVVTTVLLKRPEDRYADAAAMRAALTSSIGPAARAARPVGANAATDRGGAGEGARDQTDRTGVTRVYRTSVPVDPSPAPRRQASADRPAGSRSGWQPWMVIAATIAALTAIVGISAVAASTAPAPIASAPASASPTPTTTAEDSVGVETPMPTTPMPELARLSLVDAGAAIARAGLVLGDVSRENSASPADTVLGSSPAAGEFAPVGSAVSLRVASGNNAVPPVAGLSPAEATGALTAAGFATQLTEVDAGTPGLVAGSAPGPGELVRVGGTIVVVVTRTPPAPPTPQATPTPMASPTSQPTPTKSPGP